MIDQLDWRSIPDRTTIHEPDGPNQCPEHGYAPMHEPPGYELENGVIGHHIYCSVCGWVTISWTEEPEEIDDREMML